MKTEYMQIRMSLDEKRRLDDYCDNKSINKSAWLRRLIKQQLEAEGS